MDAASHVSSRTRTIGTSPIVTAPMAVGSMNFGRSTTPEAAGEILDLALEAGLTLINTGDTDYSGRSEEIVGNFLSARSIRSQVTLSVEISGPEMGVPFAPNLTSAFVLNACDRALSRLQTDYIDIYVIPRPNPAIAIQETLGALDTLVRSGKVRYCATSCFPAWMALEAIVEAAARGLPRIVADLSPYNLLDRRIENELLPMARRYGLSILAWAPLGQGVLAGRYAGFPWLPPDSRASALGGIYRDRVNAAGVEVGRRVDLIAKEWGYTPAQLSYLWVKAQSGVAAAIVGFRRPPQVSELLKVLHHDLDDTCLARINAANPSGTAVANFHNTAPWMQTRVGPAPM